MEWQSVSKGELYVADQKVGATFIFNTETKDTTLIRNGYEAKFGLINAVAIDDDGTHLHYGRQAAAGADLEQEARSSGSDQRRSG